ncbi:ABC transporter ATP-binding protein [Fictibacillus terranigra]|uniref:ABC transporter ATP-binding protein n=1 Tax=Fictibacillus terranigra TaxID=3058424 RepID=A0ABT8EB71_9BACL|nr:ABC transporter ATP-binding protein [Fictibacillus sp. CENA-BCM004]MDN4075141.1 ABC transporter ATP-binding protein [Fictibacillus sp. CENA-BCM004]
MKVISILKPYRVQIAVALFLMLVELAVELLQPLLIARIIDNGIMKKDLGVVMVWGGVMIGLSLCAFAAGVSNSFYASHVSQNYGYNLRKELFTKIQAFSFENFNQFPATSLITRMTNDVTQMQNTVFMSLRVMLRAPLLIIGGLVMSFIIDARLAIFIAVAVPVLFVFLMWVMKKGGALFKSVQENLDRVNGVMRENLSGIRIIKAFLRSRHEVKRFTEANRKLKSNTAFALRLMESTNPILLLVMNIAILCVLWFGSVQVNTGGGKIGDLVAVINYSTRITSTFSIFSWIIMAFSRAKASGSRISDVLNTEVDLVAPVDSVITRPDFKGEIEFQGVSFHYPGTKKQVLKDISFKAEPGETVAVMGATGSGKSSLFQLIPRLYDVDEGKILLDGMDISRLKLEHLRNAIGLVPQEALLFTGTVKENITWGKENATEEEIKISAENSQIAETIASLPKQYETRIGQKGVNLSGGQKQRLSIARALVRKPKILLLDDSTSALDLKTEGKLLGALKHYPSTILIITQKIATAMEADKILLIENGMLLMEGKHEDLLLRSSLYQQIFQSQFGEESLKHAKGFE